MPEHSAMAGIMLHTDEELGELLGVQVRGRRTVHEWPLSCVQGVRLVDGTALAYKSQLPPTVEPRYYAAATTSLLAPHRFLGMVGDCATMTIEWMRAPKLRSTKDPDELAEHGRRVVAQIGRIQGDLPVYLDVSTHARWADVVDTCVGRFRNLVADGRFGAMSAESVDRVADWADAPGVRSAVTENPVVAHGDLSVDEVFVTGDGYRVVDWQRPVRGPAGIDLASLLIGHRIDPAPHVAAADIELFWFLRLYWAVEAQHELFPDRAWPLYQHWAIEATQHLRTP